MEKLRPEDMSREERAPLVHLDNPDLMPLPPPLADPALDHPWKPLPAQTREKYACYLDDTCAVNVPQPKTPAEETALVERFLSGLDRLFTPENNWAFLQPLLLTMEHCAKCQTCSAA